MEEDLEMEFDDDLNGGAVIRCPQCDAVSHIRMNSLVDGSTVDCSCGFVIRLDGNGFASMQRNLDEFNRLLDDF